MSLFSTLFGGSKRSASPAPLAALRGMIDSGLVTIAAQPRNNALDLNDRTIKRLYVFLIDHDYPGGSAAMHNAVFARYRLPYRSCFMIGDPARVAGVELADVDLCTMDGLCQRHYQHRGPPQDAEGGPRINLTGRWI